MDTVVSGLKEAKKLTEDLWPTVSDALHGKSLEVQGATLAALTALWISFEIVEEDREEVIEFLNDMTRSLLKFYGRV